MNETMKKSMKKWMALFFACLMLTAALTACGGSDEEESESDSGFDYENADFSKYLTLAESLYRTPSVTVPYAETMTEEMHEEQLALFLKRYGTTEKLTDKTVADGDTVNIYYCGYTEDENGVEYAFAGGTAMTYGTSSALVIGSGRFIDGFESGLIGVVPSDTISVLGEDAAITEDGGASITYSFAFREEGKDKDTTGKTQKVLLDCKTCEIGEEFVSAIVGMKKGEKKSFTIPADVTGDGVDEQVTFDVEVHEVLSLAPHNVYPTFPSPYPNNPDLAGKTVRFEVYVESVDNVIPATLDEEFVTETLKFEPEDKDADLIEAFLAEFRAMCEEDYESTIINSALADAFEQMMNGAVFTKLPEGEVDAYVQSMRDELTYYMQQYGYSSMEKFAILYYGITDTEDFDLATYLEETATESVKYTCIYYYLIDVFDINPSKEDIEKLENEIYASQAANQNASYGTSYTADEIKELFAQQYGETYMYEYAKDQLRDDRLNEILYENCTVTYEPVAEDAE